MSLGARAPARSKGSSRILVTDPDPGIPLAQVPYFTHDLIRLGVVAALMVVLMLGGAQLIPLVIR
jgi:hypothetical protein